MSCKLIYLFISLCFTCHWGKLLGSVNVSLHSLPLLWGKTNTVCTAFYGWKINAASSIAQWNMSMLWFGMFQEIDRIWTIYYILSKMLNLCLTQHWSKSPLPIHPVKVSVDMEIILSLFLNEAFLFRLQPNKCQHAVPGLSLTMCLPCCYKLVDIFSLLNGSSAEAFILIFALCLCINPTMACLYRKECLSLFGL